MRNWNEVDAPNSRPSQARPGGCKGHGWYRIVAGVALGALAPHAAPVVAQTAQGSRNAAPTVELRFDAPPPDAVERGIALRQLGTTKSVLMIGAHPDDENTAVLAELALGQGADVAYLSLTRGEGGQNGIGPEQQEALGLLRTEELLAARDVDRGRQYFTRAYDFGFSKEADEAFLHWPREALLEDVVRVVRSFRPDILVAIFTGTPSDGHGQHQASGILAREAFEAAADPARFPDAGPPHAPIALYRSRFFGNEGATLLLETGSLDPLLGRSRLQIAMASRSQHRSQDMGQPQPIGPRAIGLDLVADRLELDAPRSIFTGVDTLLSMRAERAAGADPGLVDAIASARAYEAAVRRVDLAEAAAALGRVGAVASRSVGRAGGSAADALLGGVRREQGQLDRARLLEAAVAVDVRAEDATVVPGQTFSVDVSVWNGGDSPVDVRDIRLALPAGWAAQESRGDAEAEEDRGDAEAAQSRADGGPAPQAFLDASRVAPGAVLSRSFRVSVPSEAVADVPYFLREGRDGDLYAWGEADAATLAFAPDRVRGIVALEPAGPSAAGLPPIVVSRAAAHVLVDKTLGEVRLPVLAVPALSVALTPGVALVPSSARRPIEFAVRVTSRDPTPVTGSVALGLPDGWSAEPATAPVSLPADGTATVRFRVTPAAGALPDAYPVSALLSADDGRSVSTGVDLVDYPHIRPRLLPTRAEAIVRVLDVEIPGGLQVAYVEGAGDGGADALRQLGVEVEELGPDALATTNLDRFDTIVLGIRAYEFRPDVVAHNARLMDYARAGGTLVVQYNKYEFPEGDYAPYPLTMSRPHDRVTDEAAEITILEPDHALFTWPNAIDRRDFDGWVQERGLYFAATWDERYRPLLEMADPGEAPLRGSTLIAPLGEGTYVYTALSLFRQIPAGVPGAYRLLANLVALGADREAS